MDIKISFTKNAVLIVGGVVLCGLIGLGCWRNSTFKARQTIKESCDNNCGCFDNVVDYRLTDEQVRLFARFMKKLQVRKIFHERRPPKIFCDYIKAAGIVQFKVAAEKFFDIIRAS